MVWREEILLVVRGRQGGGEDQYQAQAQASHAPQHLLGKYFIFSHKIIAHACLSYYEIKMLHWSPTKNISH